MDDNLKRTLILEHYQNPFHKEHKEGNFDVLKAKTNSCIDDLNLQIKYKDDIIEDIYFDGEACVISTASTSMLLKKIIGLSKNEALDIINNYENMINEKAYNQDKLDEMLAFDNVYKQPNRKTCALLTSNTIKKYLEKIGDNDE